MNHIDTEDMELLKDEPRRHIEKEIVNYELQIIKY